MSQIDLRPQPMSIFPLPAGYLLLPKTDASEDAHTALLKGKLPEAWPEAWHFYELALNGDLEAALTALKVETSPIAAYNRFVLASSPEAYAQLRSTLGNDLQILLDVVAYTLGYIDVPPDFDLLEDELRAFVLMAQATHALEQGQFAAAQTLLQAAIDAAGKTSPIFAAQLEVTFADTERQLTGVTGMVIQRYKNALAVLEKTDLKADRGSVWLNLGTAYHEMAQGRRNLLMEAVKCYQEATRLLTQEGHPELYALGQNNLALAYLAMPMVEASDQLRMGIAVQALREALKIYTRETHPHMWASAQLNLANALQYLPSTHTGDNLVQAVEIYEELLDFRSQAEDPIGYARLLANQGNALAHLGIFEHALTKLTEAQLVFAQYGAAEAAQSVAQVIADLQQAREAVQP